MAVNISARVSGRDEIQTEADALCARNVMYLRSHPSTPRLFDAGVRYQREPVGSERWKGIADTYRDRAGDCEDLATWLAAEMRVRDRIAARPLVTQNPSGNYHVIVLLPDGRRIDPSRILGM